MTLCQVKTGDKWCPSGICLGTVLINAFVSDIDDGIKCTLRKFVGGTKLSGLVDKLDGRDAIQRDLEKLER